MKPHPKTLLGYYRRNFFGKFCGWTFAAAAAIDIIITVAYDLLRPLSLKWFVRIFEIGGPDIFGRSLRLAVILCAAGVAIHLLAGVNTRLLQLAKSKSTQKISEDLHDYVYGQSLRYYSDRMPGKIANQIGMVAGGLDSAFRSLCSDIPGYLLSAVFNFGLLFAIDWRIAAVMSAGMAARLIWGAAMLKTMYGTYQKSSEQSSHLAGKLLDSLSNFLVVKLFAGKRREMSAALPERRKLIERQLNVEKVNRLSWMIPRIIEKFVLYSVFALCAYLFAHGEIMISDMVFAVAAFGTIEDIMNGLMWKLPGALDSYASAAEAYDKLIAPVEIADDENAPGLVVGRGEIKIKNVSFNYGKDDVLKNFSLDIRPGERVGLVGLSGGGKTTLVNLLMRLYDPQSGKIEIDGQDIRHVAQESLRRKISFIPQDGALFHRSLKDNIAYGKENATSAEITDAAKQAGAHDFIMRAPKKYNSLVGDRGIKLSGGQRQRIAIARAILKRAPILIMDEATSALDSETESIVQKSFDAASEGKTTIVIAHRLSTLRHMDKIVVIRGGRISESGTHSELLKRNGEYARLWKIQSGGFIA
jgi:ATP-binding cassette subfamily B multidrug efflux pump